jgi:hypothetical protein
MNVRERREEEAFVRLYRFILGISLLLSAGSDAWAGWQIETVEVARTFSRSSLKIDSQGQAHLAYGDKNLVYAECSGGVWQYQFLDWSSSTGLSLALDSSDRPVISYCQGGDLKLARWDGSSWIMETVDTADHAGGYSALALDSLDYPAVAFYNIIYRELAYARWNGLAWNVETVDTTGGTDVSLALDSAGHPGISYFADSNLVFAYFDGSDWVIDNVDSAGIEGSGTSVVFDGNDYPAIAYHGGAGSFSELQFAKWDGTAWTIEQIGGAGEDGEFPSLALDSLGYPAIGYCSMDSHTVNYAKWDGATWTIQEVPDSVPAGPQYSCLALDSSDRPAISFYGGRQSTLHLARFDGSLWSVATVDSETETLASVSLALDSNDYPVIGYSFGHISAEYLSLKYAKWDGAAWDFETVNTESWVWYQSLKMNSSDFPVIAYTNDCCPELAAWDGASWNLEMVEYGVIDGVHASLGLDSLDHPGIAYIDATSSLVKYAKWDGATWNIEAVDAGDSHGTSLVFDSADNPMISYEKGNDLVLTLAKWNGGSWIFEDVDSGVGFWATSSLAIDSLGHPCISYTFSSAHDLKFARWDGSQWNYEIVDNRALYSGPTSLALDLSDRPSIAYPDNNSRLRFARWDGVAWTTEIVDSVTNYDPPVLSLALAADGSPVIAYSDYPIGLKLARYRPDRILRGETVQTLAEVATGRLPWTDPDPVLTNAFPDLLMYQAEGSARIVLRKEGTSITMF